MSNLRPRVRGRRLPALLVALSLFMVAACGSGDDDASSGDQAPASSPARQLTPAEFGDFVSDEEGVPVVNVHVPYEGHIEGTTDFVPYTEIGGWEGLPDDRDALIALYCMSGNMSTIAALTLADMGYTNLVEMAGGMEAWAAAGLPLVQDDPAAP